MLCAGAVKHFVDAGEGRLDGMARRELVAGKPDRDGQVERSGRQVVRQAGGRADVGQVDRAGRIEVDRAADPAVPPLVLILDVGRVRPLDDPQRERVGSRLEAVREVELGGQVRVLPDADLLAVEAHDEHALGGADMENDPSSGPLLGHRELALVDPRRVRVREGRWPARERHLDVRVVRMIPGAGHRPEARHVRLDPVRTDRGVGRREELEAPAAVERHGLAADDAVHGEAAGPRELRGGPRSGHSRIVARSGTLVAMPDTDR